eukprot:SAG31_NODE_21168_length_556_cov_0.971554_1_plen_96_part_01
MSSFRVALGLREPTAARSLGRVQSDSAEPILDRAFRNLWTDNADAIARSYGGSPALKTDFTRTGKRTVVGAMRDGWSSLSRWYVNCFVDGVRRCLR